MQTWLRGEQIFSLDESASFIGLPHGRELVRR